MNQTIAGTAAIVGPLLLLGSTIAYVLAGDGMNEGELGGAIQVWAFAAIAIGGIGLARSLEPHAPRTAALASVLVVIGAAGGVAYGIDSIQVAVFGSESIQETDSAAAPFALQIPGVLFPLGMVVLGVTLARTAATNRALGVLLAIGAVLFPVSRIPDVPALAILSDALLLVGLGGLGLALLARRQDTLSGATSAARAA